jgi:hypothetical protein
MVGFALQRVARGERMPGLIAVDDRTGVGIVIADLLLIEDCAASEEIEVQVWYVPMS